jgi:TonB family protein
MATFIRLCPALFLLSWTTIGTAYATSLMADDVLLQTTSPHPGVTKQQSPAQSALPTPDPDAPSSCSRGKGIVPPKLTYSVEPSFPDKAIKRKIGGSSTVQFVVDTDGHVKDVHIIKSSADQYTNKKDQEAARTLDDQAIQAARQYRFEPATLQGKPIPCAQTAEVQFQRY